MTNHFEQSQFIHAQARTVLIYRKNGVSGISWFRILIPVLVRLSRPSGL